MMKIKTAFVTGATGLLGNNLVRELVSQGYHVKALVRSIEKGRQQFGTTDSIELISGNMTDVTAFAEYLPGCDVLFHTAAYFRDNYKGGSHWAQLKAINVDGTAQLLEQAYHAGIRRFVHTSSIAVLNGEPGMPIDETCLRRPEDADDYYRSKILADDVVLKFLQQYPEMNGCLILPGWMWGPGDLGPTSSGQLANDVIHGKLPGLVSGSFSVVDARDVAQAMILASERGKCGERYLAAGRHMNMHELVPLLGNIAGVKTPTRTLPLPLLYLVATLQEVYARLSGKPVLLSMATVRLMVKEANRSHFNHTKSERELGLTFRPVEHTLKDTVAWLRNNEK